MYEGNGDNPGTTQERTDRCAAACFNKGTALGYGPWSSRGDAIGFALIESSGRCYCQHEAFARCTKAYTNYVAHAFEIPTSVQVGNGLCSNDKGVGIRVYEGNGDNPGTTQERTDRCAAACFNKRTALAQGPWSSRGDAIGFGLTENNGRCYCQHETFTACKKVSTNCTCQTNDVANASHSKRSAALMCRNWQLSFGYVMKRSQVFCRAFCGPYQKEGVKLAEMTPTAHFERRLFCCALQTWRTSSSLRVQKLGPDCARTTWELESACTKATATTQVRHRSGQIDALPHASTKVRQSNRE